MKDIISKNPSAHLQIVGDGADREKISKQIIDQELTNHVELIGSVSSEELRLRYSSCDLYISASRWEMFGLPLLEAMACGKPALVSDIPSHRELVELSRAGQLFPLENDMKLGDQISAICNNLQSLSESARKFAERSDWSKVCRRVADIYEKILQSR
jgi:glycosyltransferase involved in cell wall biosynthesis